MVHGISVLSGLLGQRRSLSVSAMLLVDRRQNHHSTAENTANNAVGDFVLRKPLTVGAARFETLLGHTVNRLPTCRSTHSLLSPNQNLRSATAFFQKLLSRCSLSSSSSSSYSWKLLGSKPRLCTPGQRGQSAASVRRHSQSRVPGPACSRHCCDHAGRPVSIDGRKRFGTT